MTSRENYLPQIAGRLFGRPLAIAPATLDGILHAVGQRVGLRVPEGASLDFDERARSALNVTEDGIAVVQIMGPLVHRSSGLQALCGMTSYLELGAELDRAAEDPRVSGILLEIDSGGGEVSGVFDLVDKLRAIAGQKPVYAVANESAFSAAYALASAASRIYLPRTAGVGSIGVVALHVDQSQHDAKEGYAYSYVHAGARKVDGNPHEPLAADARATIQGEIDKVYDLFAASVARNRGLSLDAVRSTEAGLFYGADAIAKGLADRPGTRDEAYRDLVADTQTARERSHEMKLAEENTALKAQLASSLKDVETLRAEVAEFKAAAVAARGAAVDAYVESIAQATAEQNLPATAEDLAEIRELMAAGSDAAARKLGDAHIKAAKLAGGKPFARSTAAPKDTSTEERKQHVATEKQMLESQGYTVTLNAEGTAVASATPPKKE